MLEVRNVFKTYEGKPLLIDISFTVAAGETICLLGASGSGKSTLLRMIAGLEPPDAGLISFDGLDLATTPPHLRDFGLVFQDYSLFPHLNVKENVAFGLRMRRLGQTETEERVASVLDLVELSKFGDRRITDLSGGEQQRVSLARALAIQPRLLMFDEPLGALDRTLREDLLNQLRMILHQTQIPAIYVTHDQEEAFALADRVLILHQGAIVRDGTPSAVWADPKSAYVAKFLGLGNVMDGEVRASLGNREWKIESALGEFVVACEHQHAVGDKIHLLTRPLSAESEPNVLRGIVADIIFQQDRFKVAFENGLYVYLKDSPRVREEIEVRVKVECLA